MRSLWGSGSPLASGPGAWGVGAIWDPDDPTCGALTRGGPWAEWSKLLGESGSREEAAGTGGMSVLVGSPGREGNGPEPQPQAPTARPATLGASDACFGEKGKQKPGLGQSRARWERTRKGWKAGGCRGVGCGGRLAEG